MKLYYFETFFSQGVWHFHKTYSQNLLTKLTHKTYSQNLLTKLTHKTYLT